MTTVIKKLLVLPIPTMCIMNGHTMAGGFIFALCHDYRIQKAGSHITLSEINVELPLPPFVSAIVSELLPPQFVRKINYGIKISSTEALKEHAICAIYKDQIELEQLTAAFAKEFSKRGNADIVLGEIKRKLHSKLLEKCDEAAYSPKDIQSVIDFLKKNGILENSKPIAKL